MISEQRMVYNKNSQGKFDIFEESYIIQKVYDNGTRLSRVLIPAVLVTTVDSDIEAQAFIKMQENMIFKNECELSLQEEFENNLERS
jgi:hypothetical protein